MVTLKTIKDYEFENIEDYYDYVLGSYINGNYGQCRELIKKLSKEQKKDCYEYLQDLYVNDVNVNTVLKILFNAI